MAEFTSITTVTNVFQMCIPSKPASLWKLNIAGAGDADGVWVTAASFWQMCLFKDSP